MHTLASKVSLQQQSRLASSPRYYYKISENQSTCSKLVKYWRILITFLFTQVSRSGHNHNLHEKSEKYFVKHFLHITFIHVACNLSKPQKVK